MARYQRYQRRPHVHQDPNDGGSMECAGCWAAREQELADLDRRHKERLASSQQSLHLSSRGWGDYSPVKWIGDITRADAEIVAECRALLDAAHDVDHRPSDAEIVAMIHSARRQRDAAGGVA